jgi:hypothetical protein
MQAIAPCRSQVSDRFPIASFDISLPQSRYFEVACATDPRLFHSGWQRYRTPSNFFTSRNAGLLRAPGGRTAWFLPPQQLRRFAGAQRIYYALASYGNPTGGEAEFTISPRALEQVPSIALAADFTGRTLDRARLTGHSQASDVYGSPAPGSLRWGGDDALEAENRVSTRQSDEYDDGHSPELWRRSAAGPYARPYAGEEEESGVSEEEQAYYDQGIAYQEQQAQAAGLEVEEEEDDTCYDFEDEAGGYGRPRPLQYGVRDDDDDDDVATYPRGLESTDYELEDEAYDPEGGYEDAAALYGAVGFDDSTGGVAVEDAPGTTVDEPCCQGRDGSYSEEFEEEELLPAGSAARALAATPLEIAEKVRILRVVGLAESGADGYSAINPDNEYNDPKHPAYHKYHIGLSWGLIQFTQRSGALGRVLSAVVRREEKMQLPADQTFKQLFGANSDELLRVTNASDEESRVAPVGGANLWEPAWTARFRAAGNVPHVQWSQNEIAITDYFDPALKVAYWLGFDTPRALAMLVDRCIHMGRGGGLSWVLRTVGPVQSASDRESALRALGFADLKAFQTACAPDLKVDGKWGPMSHAAMTWALRNLGSKSPLTVADRDTMLQKLVDAAKTTRFHKRLKALHENSTDFSDAVNYEL